MEPKPSHYTVKGLTYTIQPALPADAGQLARLRLCIDGETENLDREPGEGVLTEKAMRHIIEDGATAPNHLFLVAQANNQLVGFARCVGSSLKRLCHQTEFGTCVLKDYWGYKIGHNLLGQVVA